jgi:L-fuconolactonase
MPDFPIIDTHLHIFDPTAVRFGWMSSVPKLNRPHLVRDLEASAPGIAIEAFVFAEVDCDPGQHIEEAKWVNAQAKREPRIKAGFFNLPMEEGPDSIAADLLFLSQMPLTRGVRRLIQSHANEPGWCLRELFVAAVQSLAKYDLHFEITIFHTQIADAIELVGRCPNVRFVLDHIGKPGIKAGVMEPWAQQIGELARHENVVCKISGAITEADHAAWTMEQVKPYVDHAINLFGYDRVMFGGDWPVLTLASDYVTWVRLVDEVVAGATLSERRKLYHDNAKAFYLV